MLRLREYVLRRLHPVLFQEPSQQDQELLSKVESLQWVTPGRFGLHNSDVVYKKNLWQIAIERLKQIQAKRTPREKCNLITQVINIIQISYKLAYDFKGKVVFAAADDLIPSIVFVLCHAKLIFPFSLERYIEIFSETESQINQEA